MKRDNDETGGIIAKVLFFGLAGLIVMAVAGSAISSGDPATPRPGAPSVYASIAAETSCSALQEHFNHGSETNKRPGYVPDGPAFEGARGAPWRVVGLGYMEAADNRMRAIGCY